MKIPPEHLDRYLAIEKELCGITALLFDFLDQNPDWPQLSADIINCNEVGAAINFWGRYSDTADDDLLMLAAFTLLHGWCVSENPNHTESFGSEDDDFRPLPPR